MADRPILFSAPMVRALIEGRKTQTRRVINPLPSQVKHWSASFNECPSATIGASADYDERWVQFEHPKGGPYTARPLRPDIGDRLWVKETWSHSGQGVWDVGTARMMGRAGVFYRADNDMPGAKYFSSLFLPREFSRLTLDVTDVRVERLQDISVADVLAEGAPLDPRHRDTTQDGSNPYMCICEDDPWKSRTQSPHAWYHRLWDSINGPGAWDANPWVMAISFNARMGNIDKDAPQ